MKQMESFAAVEATLAQFVRPSGLTTGYTLDTIRDFMESIGNPQNTYRVIHVAGTSGKTSTAYYTAELLRQAGYAVGLTISPHVDSISERAQINMQTLPEEEYCRYLSEFLEIVETSPLQLSYYEILVAFAYWFFAKQKVDYAVVEVGLGGLLDGTNIIDRPDKICVITDIGYDHVEVLGDTLAQISAQKAGIIHKDNTVFMLKQPQEVLEVVRARCLHEQASLHVVSEKASFTARELPKFQRRNFHLAQTVAEFVVEEQGKTFSKETLQAAAYLYIPARMEVVSLGSKTIILDGSHNEQKVGVLTASVQEQFPDASICIVFSMGTNKVRDAEAVVRELRALSDTIVVTSFSSFQDEVRHAIELNDLNTLCEAAGFTNITLNPDVVKVFDEACRSFHEVILVTGSYFLLHDLRPHLQRLHA